ncbi:carboxypeptidase-like regulatory domain-containing protein [Hymenobacter sp. NST-14]|uniref:carboxypeptidase-like regulatory domain-containing protein n=1 Tax=Hymenobacter piscis TaxID=2839984 RepID=UPI001C02696B|nr:carboxypeptidase-like regulatory domain-containing protein [Hymenobacter piscis]MBT9393166.1 carboxypeptidase-like regulatory domain-containing protein [Hymenobacter piscis]
MKLTASPFNPETGELMPVYRDAYLRGDLNKASAKAVEDYLHRDADLAHDTLTRWQHLRAANEAEAAPSWVQKQLLYIRTEPVRFRRRATGLVASAVLVGTMVFAGTRLPAENTPFTDNLPTEEMAPAVGEASLAASTEASAARRMVTVRGRILNEDGAPLVGATVMQPGSYRGVSTNAAGEYMLQVPAGTAALRYGYGGYQDEDVRVQANGRADVTLLPREDAPAKKRRWWLF